MIGTILISMLAPTTTLHLEVVGEGYLRFMDSGRTVYARQADLTVTSGKLVHVSGAVLLPQVSASDLDSIQIDANGSIRRGQVEIERIRLALSTPGNPGFAQGAFVAFADRPTLQFPGEAGAGLLRVNGGQVGNTSSSSGLKPSAPASASSSAQTAGRSLAGAESARVIVRSESEVSSDKILLGNVADVVADRALSERIQSIEIGRAPTVGTKVTLTRGQVISKLVSSGFDPKTLMVDVPVGATVSRKSRAITRNELVSAATEFLKRTVADSIEVVPVGDAFDLTVPDEPLELVCEGGRFLGDQVTVTVKAIGQSGLRGSRLVTFRIDPKCAGVKARQPIRILMRSNGAAVEIAGKALKDAFVGQSVEVETANGTTHSGIVTSAGVVEVKL